MRTQWAQEEWDSYLNRAVLIALCWLLAGGTVWLPEHRTVLLEGPVSSELTLVTVCLEKDRRSAHSVSLPSMPGNAKCFTSAISKVKQLISGKVRYLAPEFVKFKFLGITKLGGVEEKATMEGTIPLSHEHLGRLELSYSPYQSSQGSSVTPPHTPVSSSHTPASTLHPTQAVPQSPTHTHVSSLHPTQAALLEPG